jgi:CRISPR associated protein Cas1
VPEHWRRIGRRASYVTGAPRGASSPAQAAWNFPYSLAAAEVEIALRGAGLDPGISPTGLHVDTPSRSSATFDVLEAIRGAVDGLMLSTFAERRFRRREFVQQADGRVRLTAPLARELAEAVLPPARDAAAPVAERLARTLADSARATPSQLPKLPTNLTGDSRSRGRDAFRRGPRRARDTTQVAARAMLSAACRRCGLAFEDTAGRRRKLCEDCWGHASAEQRAAFVAAGPSALAKIRQDEGRYPVQRAEVRERIARSQSARRLADLAWDVEHPRGIDQRIFEDALPALRALPLRAIAQATGLSLTAARAIRSGRPPHPRHWDALRTVASVEHPPA